MNTTKMLWIGVAVVAITVLAIIIINPYNVTQFGPLGKNNPTPVTPDTVFIEESEPSVEFEVEEVTSTPVEVTRSAVEVIGTSVNGNTISAYTFGTGEKELLLVGGIHGGYSWNTAQLAYELIDYLATIEDTLNIRITVIPLLNPDGFSSTFGTTGKLTATQIATVPSNTESGRFNGNDVDLNRNFDCQWQAKGVWQNRTVSGGKSAFSEPEAQAIQSYIQKYRPTAVIAYYSAAGGVYASNCNNGVTEDTIALMNTYGDAAGYKTFESYDYYATTGDMANWFAKQNIPAISVLLTTHKDLELEKNKAGLTAIITTLTNEN